MMRLLVNGGRTAGQDAANPAHLGGLVTPRVSSGRRWAVRGLPWAMDNDCFNAAWSPAAFWRCLRANAGVPGCWWVAVPDRVGDAAGTARRWRAWAWLIAAQGYPLAYVGQDGARAADLPWRHMAALFVGGTTAWKLGPDAARLIAAAQARGKRVHMGRVNSRIRLSYAASLGCDSVDGLTFSRFSEADLGWGVRWAAVRQARLWTAEEESA